MNSPNRIGHGERAVIVMSSKVAQKSYGTEKRSVISLLLLSFSLEGLIWPSDFYAHRLQPS